MFATRDENYRSDVSMNCRLPFRRFAARLLFAVTVLCTLGAPAAPAAPGQKDAAKEPRAAILDRLREACASEPALRGVLIADGKDVADKDKKTTLVLTGFVDREEQRKLL